MRDVEKQMLKDQEKYHLTDDQMLEIWYIGVHYWSDTVEEESREDTVRIIMKLLSEFKFKEENV